MIEQEARGEIVHVQQQTSLEYETAMRRMSALVIVIDDSLVMRKILEVCLHRAGYAVKSFPDGIQTFRWLATAEACIPALVFVDVCLPLMDGYDIIRRLKA